MDFDPAEMKGRKLGRVLTKMGKVTREQVHEALSVQKTKKSRLGELLVELGYCSKTDIAAALAGQAGMPYVDLTGFALTDALKDVLPADSVRMYEVIPIDYNATSRRLKIAMKSADNFRAVDDLRLLMGFNVEAAVGDSSIIESLIKKHFAKVESVTEVVSSLAADKKFEGLGGRGDQSIDIDALAAAASDNQVIKLINLVLMQAIKDRASDIHFEPFENEFKMRYRIDGVLYEMVPPPKQLGPAITSRIKVMSNLDIAERRLPQDGRIELTVGGKPVDLRIAILPTIHGESCVMRVLDRSNVELALERIGLRPDDYDTVSKLISRPNGIVVVTGPTGSGKTTTLYTTLKQLATPEVNVCTIEDPIEMVEASFNQMQVSPAIELGFADGVRALMRQDPDIIMIGEIRDLETAEMAIQAALTGHLVLSTLHTNDAPSAVTRLLDLGVPAYLISSTLLGVMAQRLVRTLCPHCKQSAPISESERQVWRSLVHPWKANEPTQLHHAVGCLECRMTGYSGRVGVYEILLNTPSVRGQIRPGAEIPRLREQAFREGMRPLRISGALKVAQGLTTLEELMKQVPPAETE